MIEIKKETDYVFVEWVAHNGLSHYTQATHFPKADWEAMTDEQKNNALLGEAREMFAFLGIQTNG